MTPIALGFLYERSVNELIHIAHSFLSLFFACFPVSAALGAVGTRGWNILS
jgi:hypothetical protein